MDREKVINGLRSIKTYLASQAIESTDDFVKLAFYESQKDIDDAIAMLKEQEEAIPISWLESFTRLKCMDYVHGIMLDLIKTWKSVK